MKKIIINVLLAFAITINNVPALLSSTPSTYTNTEKPSKIKLQKARKLYLDNNYQDALDIYKELYANYTNDATLNYRIAECHSALKEYELAVSFFEKAYAVSQDLDKGFYLSYGQSLHYTNKLDKALTMYTKYKENKLNKFEKQEVNKLIEQCDWAKKMKETPMNIKIINLGNNVNSSFDDYAPSISADGKTMIFTSRRDGAKGGLMANEDNKYYEDIYITTWNEKSNTWNKAESIKGQLNTEFHDASLSISLDGNQIFLYKNIPQETKSGDIYVSRLSSTGEWGIPERMDKKINTSYFESSASLTADGNTMYFVSERNGGYGNADIYKCIKASQGVWGEAINLGDVVNTSEDEVSVFMHPDGKTLFFSSKGHNSMGGYDIFKTTLVNGAWTTPVNLGYPINTVNDDLHFVMTADNKTAYYSAFKPDGVGARDIYMIDMNKYNVLEDVKKSEEVKEVETVLPEPTILLSVLQGNVFDSETKQGIRAEINIMDVENNNKIAHFTSNKSGEYFMTLVANKKYQLALTQKGYNDITEEIDITTDKEDYALVKDFTLERKEKLPETVTPEATPELFTAKELQVAFEFGSADIVLTDASESDLDYLIDNMLKHPTLKIEVAGHTDNVGSKEYNKQLSHKRASAIAKYIIARNIDKNRIVIQSYGLEKPIATNDTEEGKAKNRRVEVKLIK